MRLFPALLLLSMMCAPALAQTDATQTTAHHGRKTAAEHFADANTTHDGRLTMDQASAGYKSIAKSFKEIDVDHHGYVTMDDIKAWRAAKKAARAAAKHAASEGADSAAGIMRPIPAAQRWLGPKATNTSTDMIAPTSTDRPRNGVDLPKAPLDGRQPS